MKNWEKYEKEIKECGVENLALTKDKNKISTCKIDCNSCQFSQQYNYGVGCGTNRTNWLYEEVPKTDWSKVEVDAKVIAKSATAIKYRHFHHYDKDKHRVYAFNDGKTSWSQTDDILLLGGMKKIVN